MLKALTFLGLGKYETTTYIRHDGSDNCETDLFPLAVAKLYIPDKIIAFITPKVRKDKKEDLTKLCDELGEKFTTVDIPNGNSPDELWDIFAKCVDEDVVEENDEIILDITHAFRSIPLLIFIVAAYLRQVKNVELRSIIYGAFEARNENANETPIFNLTPFVDLLEWMNAVNVFQNYGDARHIAKLGVQKDIASTLTNLSNALLTNRTLEAQEAAMKFNGLSFDDSQQPPFQMLVEQLKGSYQQMAVNKPADNLKNSLKAQYRQIKWYMENQHYLQAITLMREWLVSWKCIRDSKKWLNAEERKRVEKELNDLGNNQANPFTVLDTTIQTATKLWNGCKIRGDLAHCGMRNRPKKAKEAIQEIESLFTTFAEFVESENLA